MQTHQIDTHTMSQPGPHCGNIIQKQDMTEPLIFNGCVVSMTSTANSTNDAINAVKEILLSSYRTKSAKA